MVTPAPTRMSQKVNHSGNKAEVKEQGVAKMGDDFVILKPIVTARISGGDFNHAKASLKVGSNKQGSNGSMLN